MASDVWTSGSVATFSAALRSSAMYDAVYLYACPRCGSEGVVIGALDPGSILCDRCYPERLTLVEPLVTDNGEAS
jgi:hypothetical protein